MSGGPELRKQHIKYADYKISDDGNKTYYLDQYNNTAILNGNFTGKYPYVVLVYMTYQPDFKFQEDL